MKWISRERPSCGVFRPDHAHLGAGGAAVARVRFLSRSSARRNRYRIATARRHFCPRAALTPPGQSCFVFFDRSVGAPSAAAPRAPARRPAHVRELDPRGSPVKTSQAVCEMRCCCKRPCAARYERSVATGARGCSACARPATEDIDTARPNVGFRRARIRYAPRAGATSAAPRAGAARPTASRRAGTASAARNSSRITVKKTCPPLYPRSRCATPRAPTIHLHRGAARRTRMTPPRAANRQSPSQRSAGRASPATLAPVPPAAALRPRTRPEHPAAPAAGAADGSATGRWCSSSVEPHDSLARERTVARSLDESMPARARRRAGARSPGRPLGPARCPFREVTR